MQCKGIIYHSLKSGTPNSRCKNKQSDQNGYCKKHKKQSVEYEYQRDINRQMGIPDSVTIKILYKNTVTFVKMRSDQRIGLSLKDVSEKFGVIDGCAYAYILNDDYIDLKLPAGCFDGITLELVLIGGC